LAAGAHDDARRALSYLRSTQRADGHWAQNTWLDGFHWQQAQRWEGSDFFVRVAPND
jgi:glucoamylase